MKQMLVVNNFQFFTFFVNFFYLLLYDYTAKDFKMTVWDVIELSL